ncbi:MAG: hypothetical protein C5B51_21830, partial [Terriglobia bacterium]
MTATPSRSDSPYPGLQPYTEAQRDYFFGRDGSKRVIAANLLTTRLTVLYGPSGAGKSSLLRAGVAPVLREHRRTAVVVFSNWSSPGFVDELKNECAGLLENPSSPALLQLPLDDLLDRIASERNGRVLLILDQFEEYLLYHGESEGAGFEAELARSVNREDVDANVLFALREDWLSKLDRFSKRIPVLLRNRIRLAHLDTAGAEDAIRKPVEVYNSRAPSAGPIEIEDGLVRAVVEQSQSQIADPAAGGTAGADTGIRAPLLQLMMSRVWEEEARGGSRLLRLQTLERL